MQMSNESLLVILLVGIVAGWLAGKIVRGTGFGIIGDLLVGIVGAFVGNSIVNATVGAILLLLVVRLLGGAGGSRWGGWGRRW